MKIRLIVFLFLCFACQPVTNSVNLDKIIPIDLDNIGQGKLSDIYDSVTYVLLKPDSVNFLADPYKIVFVDSLILIKDVFYNSVFAYDRFGQFKFRINSSGKGPNEFFALDDFSVLNDTIWIKDGLLKKELAFDLKGNFLIEKMNIFKRSMYFKGNNFSLIYLNNDPEFDYRIIRYSGQSKIPYIERPQHLINEIYSDPNGFQLGLSNSIYFSLPNTTSILEFDSLGYMVKYNNLDFGSYKFPDEERFKIEDKFQQYSYAEENNLVESITSFIVTNNGFLIYLRRNDDNKDYLLLDSDFKLVYHKKNLINDLDSHIFKEMPWTSDGKNVIYLMNSINFEKISKNFSDGIDTNGLKSNLNKFLIENKTFLKEENTVLGFFKLK